MSAETCTVSATVRLTGQRPPSTVGAGCSILMRSGDWALDRAGTSTPLSHMRLPRTSGLQLHLTSLPGGKLGASAFAFVDWLAAAGQSWWQMLPLGPPNRQRSPYKAASAFAAWRGFLAEPDAPVSAAEREDFRARNGFWIDDWAAFAGATRAINDQVRFEREWTALRVYARERGVRLIGDVPIYVAPGSADDTRWPELFRDDVVAGVPPDAFTDKGQLWGNPIYDWPALRRRHYRWWVERLRRTFDLFDLARIDHFRGFAAYWAVPRDARYASEGRWVRGPGRAVFDAARAELGRLPLIAEDLGVITPAVTRLRESLGLPGMVVLQFGFNPRRARERAPPRALSRRPGALHRHPRQRHAARLVRDAAARVGRARARGRRRRARAVVGAHGAGALLEGRGCACSRSRTSSAWARRRA